MLPQISREVKLTARSEGLPQAGDFAIVGVPLPLPRAGEALVRNRYFLVSASLRAMIAKERNISKESHSRPCGKGTRSPVRRWARLCPRRLTADFRQAIWSFTTKVGANMPRLLRHNDRFDGWADRTPAWCGLCDRQHRFGGEPGGARDEDGVAGFDRHVPVTIDPFQLLFKRITIHGYSADDDPHVREEWMTRLRDWLARGAIRLPREIVVGLECGPAALEQAIRGDYFGTVLVEL
jgi:hypothetical protein